MLQYRFIEDGHMADEKEGKVCEYPRFLKVTDEYDFDVLETMKGQLEIRLRKVERFVCYDDGTVVERKLRILRPIDDLSKFKVPQRVLNQVMRGVCRSIKFEEGLENG